jgi:hypothetical protein
MQVTVAIPDDVSRELTGPPGNYIAKPTRKAT